MNYLNAIRCDCHRLLAKGEIQKGYLEIVCGKCGGMNQIGTLATNC